jgi:hypothetical protein
MNHRLDDTQPRATQAEPESIDDLDDLDEEPKANAITMIAYFVTAVLGVVVLVAAFVALFSGCSAAPTVKSHLRDADSYVQLACMGLAQAVAARTGADAQKIIASTCKVENVTRTMREVLLSQQLDAARAQGVVVPDINSGALEDAATEEQNAE